MTFASNIPDFEEVENAELSETTDHEDRVNAAADIFDLHDEAPIPYAAVAECFGLQDGIWRDYYERPKWVKKYTALITTLAARGVYVKMEKGRFERITHQEFCDLWFKTSRRRAQQAISRGTELLALLPVTPEGTDRLNRLGTVNASLTYLDKRRRSPFPT